jgi:predicted O-methyltransferase YrrM
MADNVLTDPTARLDTIELHPSETLKSNIAKNPHARKITLYAGMSREVLHTLPLNSYDFIYVDGSHQTIDVLEDAILSFQLAKVGAIIGFDDYRWDEPPWNKWGVPAPALDAFQALYATPDRYRPLVEVIEIGWQLWVRKIAASAY